MITGEPMLKAWLVDYSWVKIPAYIAAIALVVLPVLLRENKSKKAF